MKPMLFRIALVSFMLSTFTVSALAEIDSISPLLGKIACSRESVNGFTSNYLVKTSTPLTGDEAIEDITITKYFPSKKWKAWKKQWLSKKSKLSKKKSKKLKTRWKKAKSCVNEAGEYTPPEGGGGIGSGSGGGSNTPGGGGGSGGGGSSSDEPCDVIGDSTNPTSIRIINGEECNIGDSAIVSITMFGSFGAAGCTGTVVGPRDVITAAHCISADVTAVNVTYGGSTTIPAISFGAHPDFNLSLQPFGEHDVAYVKTGSDLPTQTFAVIDDNAVVGEQGIIAGYGLVDNNNGQSSGTTDGLRAGPITVAEVTSEIISFFDYDNGNGGSNTCNGDSGGPLLVKRNGEWVLAGTTSYGVNINCGPTDISGYGNLGDSDTQDFLCDHIPGLAFCS